MKKERPAAGGKEFLRRGRLCSVSFLLAEHLVSFRRCRGDQRSERQRRMTETKMKMKVRRRRKDILRRGRLFLTEHFVSFRRCRGDQRTEGQKGKRVRRCRRYQKDRD